MLNYTIGAVRRTKKSTAKKKSAVKIGYTTCSGAGRGLKVRRTSAAGRALRLCNPLVQKTGHTVKKKKKKK